MAFSLASAPPLVKKILVKGAPAFDRMPWAASPRVKFACAGATLGRIAACSWIAATTFGCA
jgi:hypothetical protein